MERIKKSEEDLAKISSIQIFDPDTLNVTSTVMTENDPRVLKVLEDMTSREWENLMDITSGFDDCLGNVLEKVRLDRCVSVNNVSQIWEQADKMNS